MTFEQKLMLRMGELEFLCLQLQTQLEAKQKELDDLKAEKPKE